MAFSARDLASAVAGLPPAPRRAARRRQALTHDRAPPTSRSCSTGSSPCSRPRSTTTGAVLVDATLGLGGHTEAVLARLPQARVVGIDRDPDALALAGERLAPFGDRVTGVHAVYDEIPDVLADLGLAAVDARALRPRRLLDAARRRRARLRLRPGRAARHADGRSTRPHRRRRPQHLRRRASSPGSCGTTARRSSPARSPPPSCASGRGSRSPRQRRLVELLYAEIPAPPGVPAATRQAHVPGPAHRGQRRARRATPRAAGRDRRARASAAAWSWCRTTRSRTASSSGRSPRRPAATCRRDLPFVPEGHEPALRLVTRGAEKADRRRDRGQPARRVGAAARGRTGRDREAAHEQPGRPAPQRRGSPRIAEAAVERARLRVVPARRTRAAPVPFVVLVSAGAARRRRRSAAVQHLDAAGVVRGHGARGAGRRPSPPGSRPWRWSSTRCATRSGSPSRRRGSGMVPGGTPAFLGSATARSSASRAPRHAADGLRLQPRRPPSRPC